MKKKLFYLCVSVFSVVNQAYAQDLLGDVINSLSDLSQEYELDLSLIPKPSPEEWSAFWMALDTTLNAESFEDLADLLPYARLGLAYLDQYPEAKPYADWLRHQMDYFLVADEIVQEEREVKNLPPQPKKIPNKITPPPPQKRTIPMPCRPEGR